jgi:hypothetical protein
MVNLQSRIQILDDLSIVVAAFCMAVNLNTGTDQHESRCAEFDGVPVISLLNEVQFSFVAQAWLVATSLQVEFNELRRISG